MIEIRKKQKRKGDSDDKTKAHGITRKKYLHLAAEA